MGFNPHPIPFHVILHSNLTNRSNIFWQILIECLCVHFPSLFEFSLGCIKRIDLPPSPNFIRTTSLNTDTFVNLYRTALLCIHHTAYWSPIHTAFKHIPVLLSHFRTTCFYTLPPSGDIPSALYRLSSWLPYEQASPVQPSWATIRPSVAYRTDSPEHPFFLISYSIRTTLSSEPYTIVFIDCFLSEGNGNITSFSIPSLSYAFHWFPNFEHLSC